MRTKQPRLPPGTPAYASVKDWCRIAGMSRTVTYRLLANGQLHAVKLGSATKVDVRAGLAMMASLPRAQIRG